MERTNKKNTFLQALVVGLKLLLICAIIAGLIALVYHLTFEKTNANRKMEEEAAIAEAFGRDTVITKDLVEGEVYEVFELNAETNENVLLGYCVKAVGVGYGGDVPMMIGFDKDQKVCGITVMTNSETPGLGSKIGNDKGASFRESFFGKLGSFILKKDAGNDTDPSMIVVDQIGGATYSSRAVVDGVNAATAALQKALEQKGGTPNE